MKVFKIKYQKGTSILITKIKATNKKEAMYLFYMNFIGTDILDIEEV